MASYEADRTVPWIPLCVNQRFAEILMARFSRDQASSESGTFDVSPQATGRASVAGCKFALDAATVLSEWAWSMRFIKRRT